MQRPRLFLALVTFVVVVTVAEASPPCLEYSPPEIAGKVKTYGKMKVAGFSLLGVGAGSAVLGIVLMSTADWHSYNTGTQAGVSTSDPAGGVGMLLLAGIGIPGTVIGAILGVIGSGRHREYKSCLGPAVVTLNMGPTKRVAVTYRF